MTPLQFGLDPTTVRDLGRLLAFVVLGFVVSGAAAVAFRWYFRSRIPFGLATLLGVGAVASYLNTANLFTDVIGAPTGGEPFALGTVVFNVVVLAAAAAVSPVGRRVGDLLAADVFAVSGVKELDAEVSRFVRTVGRVTAVELPPAGDIEDIEGYDPVDPDLKERLGGKTLVFPRRLTVAELQDRLATRLKDDYGVGHVGVEFDADGDVTYFALGSRAAGIGPTLGPGTCAVAVEADPANSASAGDLVQIWRTDPDRARVATGELRATAGDVATVAVDEADATALDADTTYRLLTLPAEPQADREFASLLRRADETMAVVEVAEGSDVVGETVASLGPTVVAVRPAGGSVEAIPRRSRTVAAGDTLYVVGRPEALRRLAGEEVDVTSPQTQSS